MTDKDKASELLTEFCIVVDSIYGVYFDSTRGFHLVKEQQTKLQQQAVQTLKVIQPELANIEYLDKRLMTYTRGDPNKPETVRLHTCSQAELKARNEEGGANQKFIANMCLVSLYQYWEDEFRGKIEQVLGLGENVIKADIMGDINWLRQSIIHNKAVASKKVGKCKILKWFKEGAEIFIDKKMFEEMVHQIYMAIAELEQKYCAGTI